MTKQQPWAFSYGRAGLSISTQPQEDFGCIPCEGRRGRRNAPLAVTILACYYPLPLIWYHNRSLENLTQDLLIYSNFLDFGSLQSFPFLSSYILLLKIIKSTHIHKPHRPQRCLFGRLLPRVEGIIWKNVLITQEYRSKIWSILHLTKCGLTISMYMVKV